MAILLNEGLLGQLRGQIGGLLIKHYKNKTVITGMPTVKAKRNRKPGPLKKLYEDNFAAGVKYAQGILRDQQLKAAYEKKVKPGQSVYYYAISEYAKSMELKRRRL